MPRLAENQIGIETPESPDTRPVGAEEQIPEKPELRYDPGEIAPCWASPYPDAELTPQAENWLHGCVQRLGNIDVAARRWEVEQSWEHRLFSRGYQFLWPRRGGGWIYIPFATDYNMRQSRWGSALHGNETNIVDTYESIITAALTRDVPRVRFDPQHPDSDIDITAAEAATEYARVFSHNNDIKRFQHQLAYYLCTDGRALIVTDYILDAQRFGREDRLPEPAVPETEGTETKPALYLVRHGSVIENETDRARGRSESDLTEKGKREVGRGGDFLKDKGVQLIISSPVDRALDSANELSQELNVPVEVDDRLASLDIGSLAGQDKSYVSEQIHQAFTESPDEPINGDGESPNQFRKRVESALMDALSRGQLAALMIHDSVMMCIFNMFGADTLTSPVDPGGVGALLPEADGTFHPEVCFPCMREIPENSEDRGAVRGREIVNVYGKLEAKVPMNAQNREDCLWIQLSKEYDVAYVKAMFPNKADKIVAGGSVAGENELDRIARINAVLALEAAYVTGDSMVRDCTVQRSWLRPGMFMDCQDVQVREELFDKFPDGAEVIEASNIFIKARNSSMDDHLTLVHAFPGTGMNRLALGSKLISIQKRLNNWMELIDQFFVRCVPDRWADAKLFDLEALKEQPGIPGDFHPFNLDRLAPNRSIQDAMWLEPYPVHQPTMPQFILLFINELPQLLSGALPTLFGAISNTDMSGAAMSIQRDQALGRLGTPWHNIQCATASYFQQAVQLAAKCRRDPIIGTDSNGRKIRIELSSLKGRVYCYPVEDANFPESWMQRQQRYQQLIMDAAANPVVTKILSSISNMRLARDAAGFDMLKIPEADCYEKQMGEFEVLKKSGPVPNPQYVEAAQAIQQLQQKVELEQASGLNNPADIQQLEMAAQELQQIPPLISTVPIKETDNHAVEAQAVLDFINCPEGRRLANGNEEEQAAFQNLTLHWKEHSAQVKPPAPPLKPPSVSITMPIDKLPPDAAAAALQAVNLEATGPDIVQTREFGAQLKAAGKINPTGRPQ